MFYAFTKESESFWRGRVGLKNNAKFIRLFMPILEKVDKKVDINNFLKRPKTASKRSKKNRFEISIPNPQLYALTELFGLQMV